MRNRHFQVVQLVELGLGCFEAMALVAPQQPVAAHVELPRPGFPRFLFLVFRVYRAYRIHRVYGVYRMLRGKQKNGRYSGASSTDFIPRTSVYTLHTLNRDLVSRLILGICRVTIRVIGIIKLLTESP